jgi:branched-chain amino acid aminotransferase
MTTADSMKVWLDGAIVTAAEARIPVLDHGFLYGDGVFEGIRVYDRRVFRLDDHMRRLGVSARAVGLDIPGGLAKARDVVLATARAFGGDDSYVRLIVTRGEGPLSVDPSKCERSRLLCIVGQVALYPEAKLAHGVDMVTVSVRRPAADALDPRVKSLNYLNNAMAIREARLRGADEALVLNVRGAVAEASGANVFVARDGKIATPPASDGALEGITRATVLELAESLGIPAREKTLNRIDLIGADEVFLTGTGARIVPVGSLDGQPIGDGERPVTRALGDAFDARVRSSGVPIDP